VSRVSQVDENLNKLASRICSFSGPATARERRKGERERERERERAGGFPSLLSRTKFVTRDDMLTYGS
jgi:hypothetical protein